jgi:pantetheine-phosphate adenylyltransferase
MKTDVQFEFSKWLQQICSETLARFFPGSEISVADEIATRWTERQRVWHGPTHLREMLEAIGGNSSGDEASLLQLTALFHDAIYDPKNADNELASAHLLAARAKEPQSSLVRRACELIIASKWDSCGDDALTRRFFELDTHQLSERATLVERLHYERCILREYQWASFPFYREKRAEFLRGWAARFPQHSKGTALCLEILAAIEPRIGVYPGSFDPFHRGHLSILRQAERLFDKVIVAIGINRQKLRATGADEIAEMDKRRARLGEQLRFHEVATFGGLLTDYIASLGHPALLVRGVRDGTDLEAELRLSRFLNELRANSNIVWISCEAELQHLSSSAIRELESIQPDAGQRYVPCAAEIYGLAPFDDAQSAS